MSIHNKFLTFFFLVFISLVSTMLSYYFIPSPTCCLKYMITVQYLFLTNILHVSVQSCMFKTSTCRSVPIFEHILTLKKKKRRDSILILSLILLERIYIEWKMWDIDIYRHRKAILLVLRKCCSSYWWDWGLKYWKSCIATWKRAFVEDNRWHHCLSKHNS